MNHNAASKSANVLRVNSNSRDQPTQTTLAANALNLREIKSSCFFNEDRPFTCTHLLNLMEASVLNMQATTEALTRVPMQEVNMLWSLLAHQH